jgi:hypothetical protein
LEAEAAPDTRFETAQKRAVLQALAGAWDPYEVAARAGMDVRTANWQRSQLVRLLGLPKDASRMRALAAARERGLLEGVDLVEDDGSVPAIPPPTKMPEPATGAVPEPVAAAPARVPAGLVVAEAAPGCSSCGVRPRRRRVTAVPAGQLSFFDDVPTPAAPVVSLFRTAPLGAAA